MRKLLTHGNLKSYFSVPLLVMLLCLSGIWTPAVATHFMGGEITYRYLGGNFYELTQKMYRDCSGCTVCFNNLGDRGINVSPALPSGTTLIDPDLQSIVDISPLCPGEVSGCPSSGFGVEEYTWTETIEIDPTVSQYTFSNQSCCRNGIITTGPSNDSWYFRSVLIPSQGTNTAPTFLNPPVATFCVGQPATISPVASEPDGDVLVWSLTSCMQTATNDVDYTSPTFGPLNPMSSSTGWVLNSTTGELNFTPSAIEVGVVCLRVEEFRNGVKISEVTRDIQVITETCNNNVPVIDPIADITIQAGVQTCVNVSATDADAGDNVSLTATSGTPSAPTFTSTAGNPATGLWCWTPACTDAGTYTVSINATDDACPSSGTAVETFQVTVQPCPTGGPCCACSEHPIGYATTISTTPSGTSGCVDVTLTVNAFGAYCGLSNMVIEVPTGCTVDNNSFSNDKGFDMGMTNPNGDNNTGLYGFKVDDIANFGEDGASDQMTITYTACGCCDFKIAYKAGQCIGWEEWSCDNGNYTLEDSYTEGPPVKPGCDKQSQSMLKSGVSPNPAYNTGVISFRSDINTTGTLKVYDMQGRFIEELFTGTIEVGKDYSFEFAPEESKKGVYIYRIETPDEVVSGKMLFINK